MGPTATGKSELAAVLARHWHGEIINCDSMQVYRGMDIGTAKVSPELRREIPHHLLDIVPVNVFFSAGRFQEMARNTLDDIRRRGALPILAGGTGFYLRTLIHGIFKGPGRDERFRQRLGCIMSRRGTAPLYRILSRVDPESARRISPADYQRIARALEVLTLSGQPMSSHFGESEQPLEGFTPRLYRLNLPRLELYNRINQRVERMVENGLVEEVRGLLEQGYRPEDKGLEAIGYREVIEFLRDEISLEGAITRIQTATRRFAKRQLTWFRKEKNLIWVDGAGDDPAIQTRVLADVRSFLQTVDFRQT